jgi:plasmid stabilization system protein ParE
VKPLVLDDEADGEYRHAVGVYAAENLSVAVRFSERVEEALARIAAEPHIWPLRQTQAGLLASSRAGVGSHASARAADRSHGGFVRSALVAETRARSILEP